MKKITSRALTALLVSGAPIAFGVDPISSSKNLPLTETTVTVPVTVPATGTTIIEVTPETRAILQDRMQRDRAADLAAAMQIKSEAEAQQVLDAMLADANSAAIISATKERARIRAEEAGRTEAARLENIAFLSRRLRGEVAVTEAPASYRSRIIVADPVTGLQVVRNSQPRYYENNQRVVTYRSMNEVPPVLIASSRLNRVQVQAVAGSPYATTLVPVERRPAEYSSAGAYAVTYSVDPNSEVTRDDILFVRGSTDFEDAYSQDLVVDLARAISDPSLAGANFVIEGHASAEGDYNANLALSQARAERIVREMIRYGVSSSRLVPVGYGENEAEYPAGAADNLRATDRRVAVFRMK